MPRRDIVDQNYNNFMYSMIWWLILNNILMFASGLLLFSIFVRQKSILEFCMILPWVIIIVVVIMMDWYILINWLYIYSDHRSNTYYGQFFGGHDLQTEAVIKERHGIEILHNIGRNKLGMLSHRSICHCISLACLVTVLYYHGKSLPKAKPRFKTRASTQSFAQSRV